MKFRKDINGLRALAVIAVVLFHFDESVLSGGFAGVDVFFVISGFLMTSAIISKVDRNSFSLLDFYIARANRIIPALSLLCVILLIFGYFLLAPADLKQLGKHAASSSTFLSNFIYFRESGYFDVSSQQKWLLHTWSLSVEWQFYIIYPLVILSIQRLTSATNVYKLLVIMMCCSFLFSLYCSFKFPSFSYYMLPTRAWEMLLGGIAYFWALKAQHSYTANHTILGLILIISSFFLFDESTPWPGYAALIPTVGTFLVIINNSNQFLFKFGLIQKLGLWSYSIYLWHWPIVVLFYYFSLNPLYKALGFLLSIFLGFLSYSTVEQIKFNKSRKTVLGVLANRPIWLASFCLALGSFLFFSNGLLYSTTKEFQTIVKSIEESPLRDKCHQHKYLEPSNACVLGNKNNVQWAVLGDSHATELAFALSQELGDDVGLKQFTFSACKPSYGLGLDFDRCATWYNDTVQFLLKEHNITKIVIAHRFTKHITGRNPDYRASRPEPKPADERIARLVLESTENLVEVLSSAKEKVILASPFPELPNHVKTLVGLEYKYGNSIQNIEGTSLNWYKSRNRHFSSFLDSHLFPPNAKVIDVSEFFCDSKMCYAVRNGVPLYFDDNHPSVKAARIIAKRIVDSD